MNRCAVHKVDGFHVGGRKDLGVGGWGPANPYHVRIVKSIRNIGPSLRLNYCKIQNITHDLFGSYRLPT